MRRFRSLMLMTATVGGVLFMSCSKKSGSPPTAPTPDPACGLNATTLAFGTVTVGSTAERSFTLTNTGGGTLSGTVSESNAEFALVGSADYSLGAGANTTFTLRFSPITAGAKACTLSVGTSCGKVVASGIGQSATPTCNVLTPLIDFGTLDYFQQGVRTISIQNAGGGTLSGSISGAVGDFSFDDPPTFSLGPGQTANIYARFSPSSGGGQACTLQVSPAGCVPIICRGFGNLPMSGDCQVRVTSAAVDFGKVSIGSSAERAVIFKNFDTTYGADIVVNDVCPDFEMVDGSAFGLGPGASQVRYVRFTPTRSGSQACALPVSCMMVGTGTTGGIRDYVQAAGVGIGGSPQCQVSTTNLSVGTLHSGQVKDTTFTLTNSGTGTMTGTIRFLDSVPAPFSLVGSTTYSLGAGESQSFTIRFVAPTVPAGHTQSYARLIDLGLACSGLGQLTVQGIAIP